MKKILLFTMFMFTAVAGFSQDFISLKKGTRMEVIVTETTPTLVRYKLFSEPEGRVYFVYKDDVAGIMYRDGRVETFNQSNEQKTDNDSKENQQLSSPNKNRENEETVVSRIVFENGKVNTNTSETSPLKNKYGQNGQQLYMGLGLGFDYGGLGGKIEYLPVKYFGIYGGLGYNLLSVGWNMGATIKMLPDRNVSPNLMFLYGYNGVIRSVGAPEYEMVSYGITIGGNVDLRIGRRGDKLSISLFVPFRTREFMDNYDAMINDYRVEMLFKLIPIAVGVGYNFYF